LKKIIPLLLLLNILFIPSIQSQEAPGYALHWEQEDNYENGYEMKFTSAWEVSFSLNGVVKNSYPVPISVEFLYEIEDEKTDISEGFEIEIDAVTVQPNSEETFEVNVFADTQICLPDTSCENGEQGPVKLYGLPAYGVQDVLNLTITANITAQDSSVPTTEQTLSVDLKFEPKQSLSLWPDCAGVVEACDGEKSSATPIENHPGWDLKAGSEVDSYIIIQNRGNKDDAVSKLDFIVSGCPQLSIKNFESSYPSHNAGSELKFNDYSGSSFAVFYGGYAFTISPSSSHLSKTCTVTVHATSEGTSEVFSASFTVEVRSNAESTNDEDNSEEAAKDGGNNISFEESSPLPHVSFSLLLITVLSAAFARNRSN
tara:strand:- start:100 stop:1212 length:1113 start_codon:yes stop_codon:yes gene_type:complete